MTIETFEGIRIAYLRGTGRYGAGNRRLMEALKSRLKAEGLFDGDTTILGIALDDPARTPAERQRYDVGVVLTGTAEPRGLPVRAIDDGRYAVYEVPHTEEGVLSFWKNLRELTAGLPLNPTRPVIERYSFQKVSAHRCEFCVPLWEYGADTPYLLTPIK